MQKYGNGLLGWCICKGSADVIPPELHAKSAHGGIGDEIWYSSELDVHRTDGEVGISSGWWNEGLQGE